MFSPWVRLVLIAAGLLLGVRELEDGQPAGWVAIGAALLLVYTHVRCGTVSWAFQAFRMTGDVERARSRLAYTMFPRLLNRRNRTYHAWLRGVIALTDDEHVVARKLLIEAFEGSLRTPQARSAIAFTLARLAIERGKPAEARRWVEEASYGLPESAFRSAVEELGLEEPGPEAAGREEE